MTILILSNLASYTYNFRLEIIDAILQKGWRVVIACENDSDEKYSLLANKARMVNVPFNGKGTRIKEEFALIRTYRKLVDSVKPNAVLSFTIKMNLYGGWVASRRKIPFFPMITGLGELEKKGRLQKLLMLMHKSVMPKAHCIFFQNRANMDFFEENGIRIKKSVLLPGSGVNLEKFRCLPYPPRENQITFAFIGRLTRTKGIEEYLDVAQALCSLAKFYVAGVCDRIYLERVEELNRKGAIEYLGMLDDTRTLLEKINCIVLPTYHPEGMSNVLLEAGASGRPAICTDRPGCSEIVQNNVNGFFCKPRDTENLRNTVERFLSLSYEEREQMGLEARKKVERSFDRNIVVSAYMDELETLA